MVMVSPSIFIMSVIKLLLLGELSLGDTYDDLNAKLRWNNLVDVTQKISFEIVKECQNATGIIDEKFVKLLHIKLHNIFLIYLIGV